MGKPRKSEQPEAAPPSAPATLPTSIADLKPRIATPAEMVARSRYAGSVAIKAAAAKKFGDIDDLHLGLLLEQQIRKLKTGDMAPVEEMLYLQAKSLEVLYTQLLHRSMACDHLPALQANLALALKAQTQCRSTLQALADIKNPRAVAFVRQANIAQQQQVNNGASASPARARVETPVQPANELLEDASHGQHERMDPGAQGAPARSNPAVEAVGAVDGAAHSRGQGDVGAQ